MIIAITAKIVPVEGISAIFPLYARVPFTFSDIMRREGWYGNFAKKKKRTHGDNNTDEQRCGVVPVNWLCPLLC